MILLINNEKKNINKTTWNLKIKEVIESIIGKEIVLVNTNDEMNTILKKNKNLIKGVILGGSSMRILKKNYLEKILDNILPIIELDVPILGICFGMQLLGLIYQAKIESFIYKNNRIKIFKLNNSPLFNNLSEKEIMYIDHYDYLIEKPVFFRVIARDYKNRIYGIQHNEKPIFGLIFHPEFTNNGITIYKNFLKICGYN